jgi:hypothetical protein
MKLVDNFKNARRNIRIIKQNPIASLKFEYYVKATFFMVILAFICYSIIRLIINYNGGSSVMTLIGRAMMLLIMVFICIKTWQTLQVSRKTLSHYEKLPAMNIATPEVKKEDIDTAVDDILNQFYSKEELKGGETK